MTLLNGKNKRYQGFTLVESLLVLLIVVGCVFFPYQAWGKWQTQLELNHFFKQFEIQIVSAQQTAISLSKSVMVQAFVKNEAIIFHSFTSDKQPETYYLALPKSLELYKNTTLVFKAETGNVDGIKQFIFKTAETNEKVVYQYYIGSGRFVKKEDL